ncbi:hypothetical protein FXO37_36593 [Capsicum annuum]|nr:hypothetical protein FXO37_36593 [Capsicum annuum]
MNMDGILKSICSDFDPFASYPTTIFTVTAAAVVNPVIVAVGGGGGNVEPSKTVDEVWREIVAGVGSREGEMTLEHSALTYGMEMFGLKAGKTVDSACVAGDMTEAEVSTQGSIKEQAVLASQSSSQEDYRHLTKHQLI